MRSLELLLIPLFITLIFAAGCDSVSSNDSITTSREECEGVPDCSSVEASDLTPIDADGKHVLHFACPGDAPYIHNIDVDQNDNIIVEVLGWSENAVTVSLRKQAAGMSGLYQVFLGCSTEMYTGGERLRIRASVPDGLPDDASAAAEADFKTPAACTDDIPDCVDVLSIRHKIGHLKTHKDDIECPATHPWYAAYNYTVSSLLVTVTEDPASKLRLDDRGDSFLITNFSPVHDHHWQIAVACSAGCTYAPGGCPCDDKTYGCHNDPGCRTTVSRTTRCARGSCWTVWEETCEDGVEWSCNTTLAWVCCQSCT